MRLTFPFDEKLGYQPPPKDFYGLSAREAVAKRDRYERKNVDQKDAPFITYLRDTYLPYQESRYYNGELVWTRYSERKSRVTRFVLDPQDQRLAKLVIRKVALSKLSPAHVEDFFRTLEIIGISPYVREGLYNDLHVAIKEAKRSLPLRPDEYFEDIRKPVPKRATPKVYDDETIFRAINDDTLPLEDRALVAFLFIMRCRPSEMFALRWSDVDLRLGQVTFSKASRRTKLGYQVQAGTKSGSKSDRTLPLGKTLTEMLKAVQKARMAQGKPSQAVFLSMTGIPLNQNSANRRWQQIQQSLGLPPGVPLYSLKRSGNSFAARQGVGPEVRARTMGHTTSRMALETYREIADSEVVRSIDVFDVVQDGTK